MKDQDPRMKMFMDFFSKQGVKFVNCTQGVKFVNCTQGSNIVPLIKGDDYYNIYKTEKLEAVLELISISIPKTFYFYDVKIIIDDHTTEITTRHFEIFIYDNSIHYYIKNDNDFFEGEIKHINKTNIKIMFRDINKRIKH